MDPQKFYDGLIRTGIPERDIEKFSEKAKREAERVAQELYGAPQPTRIVGHIEVIGDLDKRSSRRSTSGQVSRTNTPGKDRI